MTPRVCLLVGRSVCLCVMIFLKGVEVTLPCSDRGTYFNSTCWQKIICINGKETIRTYDFFDNRRPLRSMIIFLFFFERTLSIQKSTVMQKNINGYPKGSLIELSVFFFLI